MKKIIVTGAAGMVGQNLIPILIEKNYEVIALDKHTNNLNLLKKLNPKIVSINADLAKKGKWDEQFNGAYAVVDLKAQIASKNPKVFRRNNVLVEKNILDACKKGNITNLIHASSSVVISVGEDKYTKTKRECENLVHKSNVPHTILRPTLMYGCFDVKHLDWIAGIMEKTPILPLPGSGKYIRQPVYSIDFCNIIMKCLERNPENKIYDIIGFEKINFIDLIKTIAKSRNMKRIIMPMNLKLFKLLLNTYTWLLRKPTVTPDQLTALMGGDLFSVYDWKKEFDLKYTTFKKGIKQIHKSKFYKYRKVMQTPH